MVYWLKCCKYSLWVIEYLCRINHDTFAVLSLQRNDIRNKHARINHIRNLGNYWKWKQTGKIKYCASIVFGICKICISRFYSSMWVFSISSFFLSMWGIFCISFGVMMLYCTLMLFFLSLKKWGRGEKKNVMPPIQPILGRRNCFQPKYNYYSGKHKTGRKI